MITVNGFNLVLSTGHGKRVKGEKLMSSIKVCQPINETDYLLHKYFSYKVGDEQSLLKAAVKAVQYANELERTKI